MSHTAKYITILGFCFATFLIFLFTATDWTLGPDQYQFFDYSKRWDAIGNFGLLLIGLSATLISIVASAYLITKIIKE